MAHLLISAAHKSSGKTTVSTGLCAALAQIHTVVQPFKKGPDYIDPMWLARAAGRACYNLDFYTMSRLEIQQTFSRAMQGAQIGIIEANKGLYDGLDLDGSNSNAALAHLLDAPVVLVIDARGMTRGVAPLILGYQAFDPKIRIAGVVLNKLGGRRHEQKLRDVIEHYTDVPVLGAVLQDSRLEIKERHLGLVPSNEQHEVTASIAAIAELIAEQVDLNAIRDIAKQGVIPPVEQKPQAIKVRTQVKIGVLRDSVFGFYYASDLEALEENGAELVFIDTIHDHELPAVDGLFIGGGFPETHIRELENNASLRRHIREQIELGLPVYAECGGLMYLCRTLRWREQRGEMVGALPADVVMHRKPQGRGYVRLTVAEQHPWGVGADVTAEIPAHEFHYSSLENVAPDLVYAYSVKRGHGIDGRRDGIVYRNVLASYTHLRNVTAYPWVSKFLQFVKLKAEERQENI